MEALKRYVASWALTLIFTTMFSTALGETTPVKPKDHEGGAASSTEGTPVSAPADATAGSIPAAGPTAAAKPAEGNEKIRLLQVKALLGAAVASKPSEQRAQLLSNLSKPPANEAEAAQQKKLAKDLINDVKKEILSDEEKKNFATASEKLAGDTPATADELRTAAKELIDGIDKSFLGDTSAQAAAGAVPLGGATTDPSKVAKNGADGKAEDPANLAKSELDKKIAEATKTISDLKGQLASLQKGDPGQANNADLAKGLSDAKGDDQGKNDQGQGSGSGAGGSPPGGDQGGSKGSGKEDHNPSAKNDRNNDKKDLPPLFAESKGGDKDSKSSGKDSDEKKESKSSEPLFDMAKLKEKKEEPKKEEKKADAPTDNLDAGGFGDAPVANVGNNGGIPPGNSNLGQVIPQGGGGGGGAFDPSLGGDAGGSPGGLGSSPVAGGGGGAPSAMGEFPQGIGYDASAGGQAMKYNYTKGQDVYNSNGGGGGGGAAAPETEVDEGGDAPTATAQETTANYAKRLANISAQVLIAPVKTGMDLATRPGPFGFTKIARAFLGTRAAVGLAATAAKKAAADRELTQR